MTPLLPPRLRLRLHFGDDLTLGPGKAALLEHIRDAGSISEAGRRMGMSYKRAWSLVEEMNRAFRAPLVESARGGAKGGGAVLTETGARVLAEFRALEALVLHEGAAEIATIAALLSPEAAPAEAAPEASRPG
jgi:molybdate transport system regulatory protein